ncbi:MAG TPA: glycosyltransferase [Terriglobales bacterium]|nr:glycosyltransferase [Terriglobales bacterium]
MIVLSTLILAVWIYLFFFHARFWRLNWRLTTLTAQITGQNVAVIIPARNEAKTIERCLASAFKQQISGIIHVFLVDDNSTDSTATLAPKVAREAAAADRLTVITGSALPSGWTGKVWAMQQGWEAARATNPDFVLLTDADIEHAPGNLATLLAQAERGYDLVSLMVKLHCETFAEKLLIPAFVYFFFLIYPPARIADARSKVAGAAGGCILLRAKWLEQIGGFAGIRSEIIDDCNLAARVKHASGRLWLGITDDAGSIRGYGTFANMSRMIARTAFNQLRHSVALLIACIVSMLLTFVAPIVLLASPELAPRTEAAIACALIFASYVPVTVFYKLNPLRVFTLPVAAVFYLYSTLRSAVNYWRGEGGEWKGRTQDLGKS